MLTAILILTWPCWISPQQDMPHLKNIDPKGIAAYISNGGKTDILTPEDLDERTKRFRGSTGYDQYRRRELQQMVEERLFLQEAEKLGIQVGDKEIDEEIATEAERMGGKHRFEEYLRLLSKTSEEYRQAKRNEMIGNKVLYSKYQEWLTRPGESTPPLVEWPAPAKILDYYLKNRAQFQKLESAVVIRLTVSFSTSKEREAKTQLMKSLQRKVSEGADFHQLAQAYSEGVADPSSLRLNLTRDSHPFSKEIEAAIFDELKEGEYSGVLQDGHRLYLLFIEKKVKQEEMTLADASPIIRNMIVYQDRAKNRQWLREVLLRTAYVWPEDLFN